MDSRDIEKMKKVILKWGELKKSYDCINKAIEKIETISGNFSEIRQINILILKRNSQDLIIEDTGLTDWELRNAILPLVKKKRDAVVKIIEELTL